jgi:hypothetical protein
VREEEEEEIEKNDFLANYPSSDRHNVKVQRRKM